MSSDFTLYNYYSIVKSCHKEFEDIEITCPDEEQNGAAYIQVN